MMNKWRESQMQSWTSRDTEQSSTNVWSAKLPLLLVEDCSMIIWLVVYHPFKKSSSVGMMNSQHMENKKNMLQTTNQL